MCLDPVSMTVLAVAGTGMQMYGAISAGNAADAAGKYNAGVLQRQGRAELAAANLQAGDIRREGDKSGGAIRAIQAASGTDVNTGSNVDVGGANAQAFEEDALRAIYGGQIKSWSLGTEAAMARYEGKVAKQQGYVKAASTLLSNAASGMFKGASPGGGVPSGGAPNSALLSNPYQSTRFG